MSLIGRWILLNLGVDSSICTLWALLDVQVFCSTVVLLVNSIHGASSLLDMRLLAYCT